MKNSANDEYVQYNYVGTCFFVLILRSFQVKGRKFARIVIIVVLKYQTMYVITFQFQQSVILFKSELVHSFVFTEKRSYN